MFEDCLLRLVLDLLSGRKCFRGHFARVFIGQSSQSQEFPDSAQHREPERRFCCRRSFADKQDELCPSVSHERFPLQKHYASNQ